MAARMKRKEKHFADQKKQPKLHNKTLKALHVLLR
jgi:hypothetical protein